MNTPSYRTVVCALKAMPSLATEFRTTSERMGRAYAAGILALRTGTSAEEAIVGWIRFREPTRRCESLTVYHRNGGTVRQLRNIATGQHSPTWCGDYRRTVRVDRWVEAQYADLDDTAAAAAARASAEYA